MKDRCAPEGCVSGLSAYVMGLLKVLKDRSALLGGCRAGCRLRPLLLRTATHQDGAVRNCTARSSILQRLHRRNVPIRPCCLCADNGISESIPHPAPPPNQDTFGQAQARLPRSSYLYLCRTVVRSVATAYVRLFSPEGSVKAFNMYAVHKLAEDLRELRATVAGLAVPDVDLEFAEASQLCAMLLAERVGGWVGCPSWRWKGGAPLLEEVGSPFLGGGGLKP